MLRYSLEGRIQDMAGLTSTSEDSLPCEEALGSKGWQVWLERACSGHRLRLTLKAGKAQRKQKAMNHGFILSLLLTMDVMILTA